MLAHGTTHHQPFFLGTLTLAIMITLPTDFEYDFKFVLARQEDHSKFNL